MHYMKFEAFNFVLHSSFLTLDILMVWVHSRMEADYSYGASKPVYVIGLYVMMVVHVLILLVIGYQITKDGDKKTNKDSETRYTILAKKFTLWQYILLGLASGGYGYVSYIMYTEDHAEKFIL